MTSSMFVIAAYICISLAAGFFFFSSHNVVVNYCKRIFWIQAEKCYLNFELMFMDEIFTLGKCKVIVLLSASACSFIVWYFTKTAPRYIHIALVLIGALFGWILPGLVTALLHKRYMSNFNGQLLDGISMLGGSLQAGLSLVQGLEMLASEMPKPSSQEYRLLLNEYKYGKTLDEGLERMAQRIPSEDLWIVIESILILRDTGANLVETFETIIHTIRERKKVEEKVKTLTTMGVAQAVILLSIPILLIFILNKLNPGYMVPLFTTGLGWGMLVLMIIMMALGAFLIKKIITIEV